MAKKTKYKGKYCRKTCVYKGKRIDVTGKSDTECYEKILKKREEIDKGHQVLYNPTLSQYYEHFSVVRKSEVKESTIRSQKIQFEVISNVEMSKDVRFGDMFIRDITRRNIEDAREILLNDGKKPQYLNICFAHLNHVFNCATMDDTIDKNPCQRLKQLKRDDTPIITEDGGKHRALTEDETVKFFTAARKRNSYYYNLFCVMIKTGARIGEISALYPTDIDRRNKFIHIRRTICRDETGAYIVGRDAKTRSGKRDIPLSDDLLQVIRQQEHNNRIVFGVEKDGLIFRSPENKIIREYVINREIKRICKDAGIDYFTTHCFRDTFATRWMETRPHDFKILSEILGHRDCSITLNLYAHVMTENKVKAMNDVIIKIG